MPEFVGSAKIMTREFMSLNAYIDPSFQITLAAVGKSKLKPLRETSNRCGCRIVKHKAGKDWRKWKMPILDSLKRLSKWITLKLD